MNNTELHGRTIKVGPATPPLGLRGRIWPVHTAGPYMTALPYPPSGPYGGGPYGRQPRYSEPPFMNRPAPYFYGVPRGGPLPMPLGAPPYAPHFNVGGG